ncbi:MAG: glycosyl transferase [Desulfuromonadaceae bacterium GWC2_58_13]|nr:MAG: glycosyl transferase [Desulfuromonadaceae bacterium GWC2_58_13]
MDLSIVVPVYNESPNLQPLYNQVIAALAGVNIDFELLLVDDGSLDDSFAVALSLAQTDPRVKVIRLRRNFGQTAAMAAGFDVARGEVIVPMDSDLQNDPADIPRLLEKIREGYDVVSGWRKERQDKWWSRRLPSILANRLISRMTGVCLHDYGCTLKAYKRDVLSRVNLYGEMHRFVPALASQGGASVAEMTVNHRPRLAGQSKYGIDRTLRVILDLITVKFMLKYSTRPMQLFGKWGVWTIALGGLSGMATLYMKWFEGLSMNRNPLLILTAFLFFSGVQFLVLGLLAEIITRTYHETQDKPIYAIRETVNLG